MAEVKRYTPVIDPPQVRAETDLLKYKDSERKSIPSLVDPYNEIAPGLYPGETAYTLDNGEVVAISAEPKWEQNGAGVTLYAWGRWIEADGSTKLAADGTDVETAFTYGFSPTDLETYGLQALTKDALLVILGEEPILKRQPLIDANAPVPVVPDHTEKDTVKFNPTQSEIPVLNLPPDVKLGASVRLAIEHVKEVAQPKLPQELLS